MLTPLNVAILKRRATVLSRAVAAWSARAYDGKLDALLDLSGNGLHARLGSAVGADTNDPLRLQYQGQREAYFPAVAGNYISFAALTAFGTGDFSVSAKVRQSALAAQCLIGGANGSFALRLDSTGHPIVGKTGTSLLSASASVVAAGANAVVGYTRSGTTGTYYIDGVAVGTVTDSFDYTVGQTELGSVSAGTAVNFGGWMRFARIYDAALDATAMAADAAGTRQADCVLDFQAPALVEPYASIADGLGNTLTLNRSATGRKLAVVDRDLLLLGTDDYLEVADSPLLNFGAGDKFSSVVLVRRYGSLAYEVFLAKRDGAAGSDVGYNIRSSGASPANTLFLVSDGTSESNASATGIPASGIATLFCGIRGNGMRAGSPDSLTSGSDVTTGTLSNADVLRIGRYSGAGTAYGDFEFIAAAIFRSALTADELIRLKGELLAL